MTIIFPAGRFIITHDLEKLNSLLNMLDVGEVNLENVKAFALVMVTPNEQARYVGKALCLYDFSSKPVAVARQAVGRYISTAFGRAAAISLALQEQWLRQMLELNFRNEIYHVITLLSPHLDYFSLALSGNNFSDVRYIVETNDEGKFELTSFDRFQGLLESKIMERQQLLERTTLDGFDGSPA